MPKVREIKWVAWDQKRSPMQDYRPDRESHTGTQTHIYSHAPTHMWACGHVCISKLRNSPMYEMPEFLQLQTIMHGHIA